MRALDTEHLLRCTAQQLLRRQPIPGDGLALLAAQQHLLPDGQPGLTGYRHQLPRERQLIHRSAQLVIQRLQPSPITLVGHPQLAGGLLPGHHPTTSANTTPAPSMPSPSSGPSFPATSTNNRLASATDDTGPDPATTASSSDLPASMTKPSAGPRIGTARSLVVLVGAAPGALVS